MCQLVFRLWLCAPIAPPPQFPKSTHPPFYPLLGAFWVAALYRGSHSSSLEPLAVGGGWTDSLGPLPAADGAAPTPLGAGTPSGPWVWEQEAAAPRRLTRAGPRMRSARRDPPAPEPGGDVEAATPQSRLAPAAARPLGPPWPRARRAAPAGGAPPRAVARPPSLAVFPSCTFKKTVAPWWDGVLKPHRGSYAARIRPRDKSPDGDREGWPEDLASALTWSGAQGGGEAPRHLARAAAAAAAGGICPGAPTSSREAHPGRGPPGARAPVLSEPPRGPQKFALVRGDLPLGRGGRCGRRGRPPPPARVSGTAAGGPPGGRRAPQPRSDGRGGGGGSGARRGAAARSPPARAPPPSAGQGRRSARGRRSSASRVCAPGSGSERG